MNLLVTTELRKTSGTMKRTLTRVIKILGSQQSISKDYYRDYYYNRIISDYSGPEFYSKLIANCKSEKTIITNVAIGKSKGLEFGCSQAYVKQEFGKPAYHVYNKQKLHTEILFFKLLLGKHKIKCQAHFFEDELFLYHYSFPYLKTTEYEQVFKILEEKYLNEKYSGENIIDVEGGCINVVADVSFTVYYIDTKSKYFTAHEDIMRSERLLKNVKEAQEKDELFERL